jgi:hypothetical protein
LRLLIENMCYGYTYLKSESTERLFYERIMFNDRFIKICRSGKNRLLSVQ